MEFESMAFGDREVQRHLRKRETRFNITIVDRISDSK